MLQFHGQIFSTCAFVFVRVAHWLWLEFSIAKVNYFTNKRHYVKVFEIFAHLNLITFFSSCRKLIKHLHKLHTIFHTLFLMIISSLIVSYNTIRGILLSLRNHSSNVDRSLKNLLEIMFIFIELRFTILFVHRHNHELNPLNYNFRVA